VWCSARQAALTLWNLHVSNQCPSQLNSILKDLYFLQTISLWTARFFINLRLISKIQFFLSLKRYKRCVACLRQISGYCWKRQFKENSWPQIHQWQVFEAWCRTLISSTFSMAHSWCRASSSHLRSSRRKDVWTAWILWSIVK